MYHNKHMGEEEEKISKIEVSKEDKFEREEEFFDFYEEMYIEASKFGEVEEVVVCDNIGDHMVGHVYLRFADEEDAADCLTDFKERYFDGRRIDVEFSPVTDFRESRCRQFDDNTCTRGGFCNFMHIKPVPYMFLESMRGEAGDARREHRRKQEAERQKRRAEESPSRSRSRSRSGSRSRSRSPP